jgi:hypothetical protein
MPSFIPRLLLVAAGVICALGAIAHALAYGTAAEPALAGANLPQFFGAEMRVLWLADSTTLGGLALIFGYVAAKPRAASGGVTMLIALLPGATALLLYRFLGGFYAGHLLMAASGMAIVAGSLMLTSKDGGGDTRHAS